MLSDIDIKKEIDSGDIIVDPLSKKDIQPASIDLRVSDEFRVFENHKYSRIDPREEQEELTTLVKASDNEPFVLHPGEFVLGSTYEKISLSNRVVDRL